MTPFKWVPGLLASAVVLGSCGRPAQPAASLVLKNAEIYTMEADHPWARALVVSGGTIAAVLDSDTEADAFIGPNTRVVDLAGRFVLPGFIDGHVHFNAAGALINDVNLMTVADDAGLKTEVARVGGSSDRASGSRAACGAPTSSGRSARRRPAAAKTRRWKPDRRAIDDAHPAQSVPAEQLRQRAVPREHGRPRERRASSRREPKGSTLRRGRASRPGWSAATRRRSPPCARR